MRFVKLYALLPCHAQHGRWNVNAFSLSQELAADDLAANVAEAAEAESRNQPRVIASGGETVSPHIPGGPTALTIRGLVYCAHYAWACRPGYWWEREHVTRRCDCLVIHVVYCLRVRQC